MKLQNPSRLGRSESGSQGIRSSCSHMELGSTKMLWRSCARKVGHLPLLSVEVRCMSKSDKLCTGGEGPTLRYWAASLESRKTSPSPPCCSFAVCTKHFTSFARLLHEDTLHSSLHLVMSPLRKGTITLLRNWFHPGKSHLSVTENIITCL